MFRNQEYMTTSSFLMMGVKASNAHCMLGLIDKRVSKTREPSTKGTFKTRAKNTKDCPDKMTISIPTAMASAT